MFLYPLYVVLIHKISFIPINSSICLCGDFGHTPIIPVSEEDEAGELQFMPSRQLKGRHV